MAFGAVVVGWALSLDYSAKLFVMTFILVVMGSEGPSGEPPVQPSQELWTCFWFWPRTSGHPMRNKRAPHVMGVDLSCCSRETAITVIAAELTARCALYLCQLVNSPEARWVACVSATCRSISRGPPLTPLQMQFQSSGGVPGLCRCVPGGAHSQFRHRGGRRADAAAVHDRLPQERLAPGAHAAAGLLLVGGRLSWVICSCLHMRSASGCPRHVGGSII